MNRRDLFKLVGKIGIVAAAKILPWHLLDHFGITGDAWIADAATLPQNYVVRQPTLITDFASTTGMTLTQGTGSVALDATPAYVRTGSQSLKIVQQASASSAFVDLDCRNVALGGTGADGFSAAADNLWHLRSFTDNQANHSSTSFFVSNTAAGFADYFAGQVLGPGLISAAFAGVDQYTDRVENRADWATGAGSPSWATTIKTIRIRPQANANGVLTTWLDALYRGGYARPKIVISFDDSSAGQYTLAKPILDTFGFKATFYVIGQSVSTSVGGALSAAQARLLYADGHDIAPHAWTNNDHNNYSTLTRSELVTSHTNLKAWMQSQGFTRALFHHAMPTGAYSATIEAAMADLGMQTGRSTTRLPQHHLFGLDNPRNLRGYTFAAADGTAGAIGWINTAIKYGTTLNLTFHAVDATTTTGAQINTTDLTTILRHLYRCQQANLLDVPTISQWYSGLTSPRPSRS